MKSFYLLAQLALFALVSAKPTVYLIRHGEKPSSGNGLNAQGQQRAQCLRSVFGKSSKYQITHIMAQTYKPDGSRKRPYDTVKPLADDLGLTVDVSCDRDDPDCVEDVVKGYSSSGNILIAWEHDALSSIVDSLGAKKDNVPKYPSDRFDIIWTDPPSYDAGVTSQTSENCPGLDKREIFQA